MHEPMIVKCHLLFAWSSLLKFLQLFPKTWMHLLCLHNGHTDSTLLFSWILPSRIIQYKIHLTNKTAFQVHVNQSLDRAWRFQEVEAPRFQDNRHLKTVRLSALRTGRLYPPRKYSWHSFLLEVGSIQGHNAVGRIMPTKLSSDTNGNRTPNLPACNTVPSTNCATACPQLCRRDPNR
jgi:hypothetical protein